jgi:hypothetical protein
MKPSKILFRAAEDIDNNRIGWVGGTLWDAIENKGCALGIINIAWKRLSRKKAVTALVHSYHYNGSVDKNHMNYVDSARADLWNGAYEAVHAVAEQLRKEGRAEVGISDNSTVYVWNDSQKDKRVISRKFRKVARQLEAQGR